MKLSKARVEKEVAVLGVKYDVVKNGVWPQDSFCILRGGPCPAGFTYSSGSFSLRVAQGGYLGIGSGKFGMSYIKPYIGSDWMHFGLHACCK